MRNPYLWHFAMHAIPALPELLTQGRQGQHGAVPGAGHFTQEEAPAETWKRFAGFIGS